MPDPSQPPGPRNTATSAQRTALSGHIVSARVRKTGFDHCELDLLDPSGRVMAKGRLYQAESIAAEDPRLLAELPRYQAGELLPAVFIDNLRPHDGQALWYVNERWGVDDPWPKLTLNDASVVRGTVTRRVGGGGLDEPAGYIVQLRTDLGLLAEGPAGLSALDETQPDITVYLPTAELPWLDGGLYPDSDRRDPSRLRLEIGDPVQAVVLEVLPPPKYPRVSITRLIHHLDASSQRAFTHGENLARWRFRGLLGDSGNQPTPEDSAPLFAPDERPYAGRRLLLVDDDPTAATSQAELLRLMGAEVRHIEVQPGRFGQAVESVIEYLRQEAFDLTLVDNNLPGRDLGRRLIQQVRERLGDEANRRLVLLTANAAKGEADPDPAELRAEGISGLVHRPMPHATLQRLLAGEAIWDTPPQTPTRPPASPTSDATTPVVGPAQLLATIASQPGVQFTVLLPARRRLNPGDLRTAGRLPFTLENYDTVLEKSGLGLLVAGRTETLAIRGGEAGNESLRMGRNDSANWQVLTLGRARWIFGVGCAEDTTTEHNLGLWQQAMTAALEAEAWRDSARHHSAFIQLGLAHQGLTHEIFNLQDEFGSRLGILRRRLDRLRPEGKPSAEDRQRIEEALKNLIRVKDELLTFAKSQLRAEAYRNRQTFLPEAIEMVRHIVATQCAEAEVKLSIAAPPPLAVPVPHAAVVLPLVNLIVNAAKHQRRKENRRVDLTFDLGGEGAARTLIAQVRDNGFGLQQATLERLFEPGYSGAEDIERRHGIGLWLSQQLVTDAGGTLTLAETWRGLGACFRLELPLHIG